MKDRPGAILANTEPHHVGKMKKELQRYVSKFAQQCFIICIILLEITV